MRIRGLDKWQQNMWAAVVVQVLSMMAFQAGFILIPFYLQDLGVQGVADTARWTGLYQTVGAVSFAIATPIWGALGDRYGRKPNLVRAAVGTAAMLAFTAFVRTPLQLIILRAVQGAVTGTPSASTVLVASGTPKERIAYALGLMTTAFYVGISLGPMLGGYVSDYIGYRNTFLMSTGIVLVAIGVAVFLVIEPDRDPEEERSASGTRNPLAGIGILARNKLLLGLISVNIFVAMTYGVTSPAFPILVQQIIRGSASPASVAGAIVGVSSMAAAASSLIAGRFSDRIGHRKMMLSGMLGTSLLYLPVAIASTPLVMGVLYTFNGLFRGTIGPSHSAQLVNVVPKDRTGVALGLNSSAFSAGFAIGPIIGAAVVTGISSRAAFIVAGLLFLTGNIIAFFVTRHIPQPAPE